MALTEYHKDGTINESEDDRWQIDLLTSLLLKELPKEARFHFARLARVRQFQHNLAEIVIRISTASSGIIAFPLMVVGMPVVATVRAVMIGTIMFISGREVTFRSVREFIIAQGFNIGVSNGLEVITHLGLIAFPGVGNAVFGGSAVLGTEALGNAAINYFIKPLSVGQSEFFCEVSLPSKSHILESIKNKEELETKGAEYYDEFA